MAVYERSEQIGARQWGPAPLPRAVPRARHTSRSWHYNRNGWHCGFPPGDLYPSSCAAAFASPFAPAAFAPPRYMFHVALYTGCLFSNFHAAIAEAFPASASAWLFPQMSSSVVMPRLMCLGRAWPYTHECFTCWGSLCSSKLSTFCHRSAWSISVAVLIFLYHARFRHWIRQVPTPSSTYLRICCLS